MDVADNDGGGSGFEDIGLELYATYNGLSYLAH